VAEKEKTTLVHFLKMDKPTVLYTAGSYGAFLNNVLNEQNVTANESYHTVNYNRKETNTTPNFTKHHVLKEDDIDGPVIKITYSDGNIAMINRNKWTKYPYDLEEQSKKLHPKHKNRELYTMARYAIDLMRPDNHFRKIEKETTYEFKMDWFRNEDIFVEQTIKCSQHFGFNLNKTLIQNSHIKFMEGQQNILTAHFTNSDSIAHANSLASVYYDRHGADFIERWFEQSERRLQWQR